MKFINNKKRILTGIIFASILLSTNLGIASTQAASQKMYGDVNNDLKVDNMDLTMFCQYMVKDISFDVETMYISDLNENGSVGIDDLALLKQYIMGDKIPKIGTYKETTQTEITTESITTSVTTTNETTVTTGVSTTVTEVPVTTVTELPITEAKTITLNGTSIVTTGKGTEVNGSIATIKEPGVYVITGTLNDGQIIVNVDKTAYPDAKVELSLEGATINCSNNSAIYVSSVGDECAITAKKDTLNTISDGSNYTNADGDSGAIYSKDDLKIKGKGNLVVKGNYTDGIVSKDSIKIFNGNIKVTSVDDGIRGKDSVKIGDLDDTDFSALKVDITSSSGDGIKATNETDVDLGKVIVNGGTVVIKSFTDAIDAAQSIEIKGGEVNLFTNQGSKAPRPDGNTTSSSKGLKAKNTIMITNGIVTIDSTDDAIHSNKDVFISGGNLTISTADDGIHADEKLTVDNGEINILTSFEGIEGSHIVINDGNIRLYSKDDGINAAGGDVEPVFGTVGDFTLTINNGYIYVKSDVDGLDSNGHITFNGGNTVVLTPTNEGGAGPLDPDGSLTSNGGTVVSVGGKGYVMAPAGNSTQNSVLVLLKGTTDSYINIKDSTGKDVVTYKANVTVGSLVYSGPELKNGQTYTVSTGGNYSGGTVVDGVCTGGTYSGGVQEATFTVNGITTLVGTTSNGFQFGGGFGGWTW